MTQDGAGKLGEEALDEVEPGAVLGRERKVEAACRSCVEPGSGFLRDMCGMIVENQLDRGAGRIGGIEKLEEFDKLAAAVAVSDERVDLAGEQINPSQQAERAMAFVLMVPCEGCVDDGKLRAGMTEVFTNWPVEPVSGALETSDHVKQTIHIRSPAEKPAK